MTQDMSNKIMTREITQWGRFFLRDCGTLSMRVWRCNAIHCVILLLLMVVGVNTAWGQATDYSGTYYIASKGYDGDPTNTNNYYLCPTEGWIYYKATDNWDTDGTTYPNPFLTTYQCKKNAYHSGDPSNAVWIIERHPTENYYYIKHKSDGKYLVSNGKISGTSNANRMRVHLESVAQADLDDKALFFINTYSQTLESAVRSYLIISPKSEDGWNKGQTVDNRVQDLKYYSVNNGNQPYFDKGNTKTDGPEGRATGGIIGVYTENDQNAQFYFEDVITRPTITCNTSNQIEITAAQSGTFTVKYTTDGSTPSADNGETYSGTFNLAEGITTIKAITIGSDWVSNVATFTNQKRLIQSQNNVWSTTDFHFYMVPGDEASGITKVNTTSLFRPSMEWTFQSARVERGIQYYYIINNANNKYLCYDATYSVYLDDFGSGGDKFKFFMKESSRFPSSFHIIPYGKNLLVSKNNGNSSADAINTVENNTNSNNISENAHWKFILPTNLDTDAPFTVSNTSVTKYYQLANVGSSGYYIIPPTGNNTNATTSNSISDADVERGSWYFEQAQAATASDWCTYYHIRNAETGKYLYFTKDANDAGACLEMKETIESGEEERYKFTWARTATENTYYIIPKLVKDASHNQFSTLRRDNGTLKSNLTRGAGTYAWTFDASSYHCTAPEVTYDDTNNQIEISSPQGVGVYYTIDGADDNVIPSSSTHYTHPLETGSTSQIIRAVCARSGDGTDNSDVVTIIFNPTVTLSDASVTYDGDGHQPTISSVEYNSTDITSECEFAKYLDANGDEVTSCKDAGDYSVVITDADGGDYYVYGSTTFTINPITGLVVTPNDGQSKEYGDPDPELTYTRSGTALLTGDELTGALSRAEGETVGGTYAITQGTLGNTNYDITFTTGKTFTITQKILGSGSTPAPNITCDITETNGTHSIVVKQGGNDLTLGTDYTKNSETENTKYYNVTVAGTGNYEGGFSVKLAKIKLSKLTGSSSPGGAALFVSNSGDGNFEVPSDMTAYIVTGISGNTLVIEDLDNIPDNVPVLLLSTIDANGFVVQAKASATPPTGTNLLKEVTDDPSKHFNTADIYLLYKGEFVLNMEGDLAKGKIYLPKPSGVSPAPARLGIVWEQDTSIDTTQFSVLSSQLPGTWYTLDGRRLNSQPTKKGLYLWKGKKVVVK